VLAARLGRPQVDDLGRRLVDQQQVLVRVALLLAAVCSAEHYSV
jgi:hypothetical protein